MSTRMSLWSWRGVHLYVEMRTDWVRLSIGGWLDVGLYPRLRSMYRPAWLGRFACWTGHHDWLLYVAHWPSERGPALYRCQRCQRCAPGSAL